MGDKHICAINTENKLNCWGIEKGNDIDYKGQTAIPSGWDTDISKVSCGGNATCAINTSKELKCWGGPRFGDDRDMFQAIPTSKWVDPNASNDDGNKDSNKDGPNTSNDDDGERYE